MSYDQAADIWEAAMTVWIEQYQAEASKNLKTYEAARHKFMTKQLQGTGWTDDQLLAQCMANLDAR